MGCVKVGLTISFIILFSLLLWLVIGLKGSWILKIAIITVALLFSSSTILTIENFYGWPATQPMPKEFRVYWALIEEPNESEKTEGALYFWAESTEIESSMSDIFNFMILKGNRMRGVRAYRLPYSDDMREITIKIVKKIMNGEVVIGTLEESTMPEEFILSDSDEDGEGETSEDIKFYSLPPSGSPRKGE